MYWERLRTRESYDIFVRLNESDKENELVKVEYKDDIVKRIIDDYKRSFKEYDKALDELNNRKRELIEHLVRSIDYTKERIWRRNNDEG